jgi:hypothetical protein
LEVNNNIPELHMSFLRVEASLVSQRPMLKLAEQDPLPKENAILLKRQGKRAAQWESELISVDRVDKARELKARSFPPGIYPAEPIMGLYAIPTAVILHGNPLKAREVHCHKLSPKKVRALAEPLGLTETHHEFNLWKSPQFVSVFEKPQTGG